MYFNTQTEEGGPTSYQLAVFAGLQRLPHVYAGTARPEAVSRRRAKNRVARASRRANRG